MEWNRDSRSDAQSFLLALSQFPFIVGLHITQAVLGYTKGLSINLQGKYVDVAHAHHDIEQVKSTLLNARRNVELFHKSIYGDAKRVTATVGIKESAPHLAIRQQHRTNIHADNCIQYYQRNLTIPLLDHLIAELNNRFDPVTSQHVIELKNLLPSAITSSQHHDFENVLKMYGDDLPSSKSFPSELHLWLHKWSSQAEVASALNTPENALKHAGDFFPNIKVLLKIMGTLPVTSCDCERSISMLLLIKTPLRNTTGQVRLNGLAMLFCHREIKISPEQVVEEFARRHPKRMLL